MSRYFSGVDRFWAARLLALALYCLSPPARAEGLLRLDARSDIHDLAPHATYLHDTEGTLDLAAARARAARGEFVPAPRDRSNFGYLDGALWFRFTLENAVADRQRWLLLIEYPLLDEVTLFSLEPDGRIGERQSGDRARFDSRDADLRHLNFELWLPAGEKREFYLRVESQSSMQVPLVVARADSYLASQLPAHLGLGLYYGILLALLLYNLILWVSVRDRNFLWYVLYVASLGMLLLSLNGFAFQYFWPAWPDWGNLAVPVSIALANLTMLQFSRSFLELPRHAPRADRVVVGFMLCAAAPLLAAFLLPYRVVVQFQTVLALLIAPVILVCAIACLRAYAPARHFLVAWSALLVGVVVYAAVSLGLLPKVPLTEYSMQIGSAAEMILLSFALAYRINVLKAENERIQGEAREQLEARVRARTAELDATMHRLEDANRRLQDFSRRDGLTGVYNRRHLDDIAMQACHQARESVRPLALVMVDVDHFKQINDRHGHVVGDDCLRAIAQLMERRVREAGGTLARYGGEEFVAVLPNHDLERSRELAEGLRNDVANKPILAEGVNLALTVSIGLYAVPPGYPCSAAELMRHADSALYRAKHAGRNRVEVASLV
jgi:diguanylate cyclase (GGDEF)-like protein